MDHPARVVITHATAAQSQWCESTAPLHTPPGIFTAQRAGSPASTVANPNFLTHSARTTPPPRPRNAFAQVIPVGAGTVKTLVTSILGLSSVAAHTSR